MGRGFVSRSLMSSEETERLYHGHMGFQTKRERERERGGGYKVTERERGIGDLVKL